MALWSLGLNSLTLNSAEGAKLDANGLAAKGLESDVSPVEPAAALALSSVAGAGAVKLAGAWPMSF
jgi:hypothetical protein